GPQLACCSVTHALVFVQLSGARRGLHSFPTRRSSDLQSLADDAGGKGQHLLDGNAALLGDCAAHRERVLFTLGAEQRGVAVEQRSEEHTSELQSRENLVCRLLLEKKNNTPRWRHARRG